MTIRLWPALRSDIVNDRGRRAAADAHAGSLCEIFPVGVVMTLVSAAILRRERGAVSPGTPGAGAARSSTPTPA